MPRKLKPKQYFEQLNLGLIFDDSKSEIIELIPKITRHFIGWERPVLEGAVEFLAANWPKKGALDLSNQLVVAPTRNAGRRLREALALKAAEYDAAVLPPLVVTPTFLSDPTRLENLAKPPSDQAMTLAIWTSALLDLDLRRYRQVFPIDPVDRNLAWAINTARDLLQVRELLCREGLSFAKASRRLGPLEMETNRWRELARLEREMIKRTESHGFTDPLIAIQKAARTINLPTDVEVITVLASPDLPGIARDTLKHYSKKFPLNIVIAAPEEKQSWFDEWGKPLPKVWLEAEIELPDPQSTIHSAHTPGGQAEIVKELVSRHGDPAKTTAIGVPDQEVTAPVEQVLATSGLSTHDPSGKPVKLHPVFFLLEQTHRLLETSSFNAFRQLLRIPDWLGAMLRSVEMSTGEYASRSGFLKKMDELAMETLPDSLPDARFSASRRYGKHPELEHGINWIQNWIRRFNGDDFSEAVTAYLADVFESRKFAQDDPACFPEVANHVLHCLDVLRETEEVFSRSLSAAERFQILLELIHNRRIYAERSAKNIDLEGWLELHWEDAPHLIVTGMNDSQIPESIVSHAYLPDSARKVLEITDNDARFSRDAYFLRFMVESRRRGGGRVDFVFGRQSVSGDPLRPSRLLFQCSDEELPERTLQFFSGESQEKAPQPWRLAWELRPGRLPRDSRVFQKLSVTAFKNYLACPFRFYLKHGLGMDEVETGKSEMNAMEFGNLIHDVLEAFGKDEEASLYTDPGSIREYFYGQLDRQLNYVFGKFWTTPVVIQREAARQRLSWWAEIEAEQRELGWKIFEAESKIGSKEYPFSIDGLPISGRIDRIEKHSQFGYRVFDFKTFSPRGKDVSEFHLKPLKRSENIDDVPIWNRVTNASGQLSRWVDLQLPLYHLAVSNKFRNERVQTGYVTLGPTRKEVAINIWSNFEADFLESAEACAFGVVDSIRSHQFWPPREEGFYADTCEELFFGDPLAAIDPTNLLVKQLAENS